MEAAIGYQKIAPRPMIPPPIRACPNRNVDRGLGFSHFGGVAEDKVA